MSTMYQPVSAMLRKVPAEQIRLLGQQMGLWNHGFDFSRFCRQLFGEIDFRGKTMMDIGCGKGMLCLWAALHGASKVVGLEPLADGAYDSSECHHVFRSMARQLALPHASILPCTVQEYAGPANQFDLVLSVASINHLDEKSCIALRSSPAAVRNYHEIFRHIADLMKPGGKLIIMDAGRRNFFGDLGIRNPFTPNIEWFKHQQPEDWAAFLEKCGFCDASIRWANGKPLRYAGLTRVPKLLAYFGQSVFRLEMTRTAQ